MVAKYLLTKWDDPARLGPHLVAMLASTEVVPSPPRPPQRQHHPSWWPRRRDQETRAAVSVLGDVWTRPIYRFPTTAKRQILLPLQTRWVANGDSFILYHFPEGDGELNAWKFHPVNSALRGLVIHWPPSHLNFTDWKERFGVIVGPLPQKEGLIKGLLTIGFP